MIHLRFVFWIWEKCLRNNPVHSFVSTYATPKEFHGHIPVILFLRR